MAAAPAVKDVLLVGLGAVGAICEYYGSFVICQ